MKNQTKVWQILSKKKVDDIIGVLLKNRGIRTKAQRKDFFSPTQPEKFSLSKLKIDSVSLKKALLRIKKALAKEEKIIIYGDYDADGICATAILWETLFYLNKKTLPYIPERFSEGYGLNKETVKNLKKKHPKLGLIITVDNGIVAHEAVNVANEIGIDVIITDHHLPEKRLPKAHAIIHTTEIGGAALAWILSREIRKALKGQSLVRGLSLAALGTISDQLPLIGANRSFARYGLEALNRTQRLGLLELLKEAGIKKGSAGWRIGTYEVNFIIAPRINAMGRLEHAIDSLRLLCTNKGSRAKELALLLGKTNQQRQKIVGEVVLHATEAAGEDIGRVIILAHETYHEGVIGLAASRLVEKFYRPTIVLSKGEKYSKASARSISGFNIIETLRAMKEMWVEGGGHPMAAGFTIETGKIESFSNKFNQISESLLTEEILTRKLKVDLEVDFNRLNWELMAAIEKFEPTGVGNPTPSFATKEVEIFDLRTVGADARHLKLVLRQNDKTFDAIAFGLGYLYPKLTLNKTIDVAYTLEENIWNNRRSLQLKIKDIRLPAS